MKVKLFLLTTVLVLCFTGLRAQVTLAPAINSPGLPAGSDSICYFPIYIDTSNQFMASGFQVGNLVPDFTLYDENGTAFTLSNELAAGQPVLLIAGSYTCPAFRDGMTNILPAVYASYSAQVKIRVVYTIEAHPKSPDVSPYSGTVWTTNNNFSLNILYAQQHIYDDRKHMAHIADSVLSIPAPILFDSPCNEWALNYGPAPNNAYLITPDGHVYSKYGWFNATHEDVMIDIAQLLSTVSINNPQAEQSDLAIYPNPSEDASVISVKAMNDYAISIYDITGREVARRNHLHETETPLASFALSPGTYLCTVADPKGTVRLHEKFTVR